MFFVFHILLFTFHICELCSFSLGANNLVHTSLEKRNVQNHNSKDGPRVDNFSFDQKAMFQILHNLTKIGSNNLKSNVFDKMLSDEMLSVQQKLYEKDLIEISTVKRVKQGNAPTPTIEVHPKWSVVELFTKTIASENVNQNEADDIVTEELDIVHEDFDKTDENITDNKILELRSLPSSDTDRYFHRLPTHKSGDCSGHKLNNNNRCSRTVAPTTTYVSYSIYPALYMQYQPYFLNENTDTSIDNNYYRPSLTNDDKKKKNSKRRKTTTIASEDELYYDDSGSKETHESKIIFTNQRHRPRQDLMMNIEYDLVDDTTSQDKLKHNVDSHKEQTNCPNQVLDDLNEIYIERVKKKCYCSKSSVILSISNSFLIYFTIAFEYFYKNNLLFA